MAKMSLVVRDLSATLGEDTADLQLRVGLHSGPVTAGVLRGGKILLLVTLIILLVRNILTPIRYILINKQPVLGFNCSVIQ